MMWLLRSAQPQLALRGWAFWHCQPGPQGANQSNLQTPKESFATASNVVSFGRAHNGVRVHAHMCPAGQLILCLSALPVRPELPAADQASVCCCLVHSHEVRAWLGMGVGFMPLPGADHCSSKQQACTLSARRLRSDPVCMAYYTLGCNQRQRQLEHILCY